MAERWAIRGMGFKGETPGRFGLSKHTTRQSCVYASVSLSLSPLVSCLSSSLAHKPVWFFFDISSFDGRTHIQILSHRLPPTEHAQEDEDDINAGWSLARAVGSGRVGLIPTGYFSVRSHVGSSSNTDNLMFLCFLF